MSEKQEPMNPNEIREWEMKIARFEGINTEILGYNVQKGSAFLPFPMTTHYTQDETKELAEVCSKRIGGVVIPQTADPIPEYHKSLPDLMRVLKKFERSSITTIGEMVTCQISLEIPLSRADIHDTYESAIFNAIIRNL